MDLLDALSRTPNTPDGGAVVLRRGVVSAFSAGPPKTCTITVGGVLTGDLATVYTGLPCLNTVTNGAVVFWLQTGTGTGLVLGAP